MSNAMWVIVEHDGAAARGISLELLARGRQLGVPTVAVVLAADAGPVAQSLGGAADEVLAVNDGRFASYSAEDTVGALEQLIGAADPSLVVAGATSTGRDFMPRLAARLGKGLAPGCTALDHGEGGWCVRRPVQGGKAYAELTAADETVLATVRPNTYSAQPADGQVAPQMQAVDPGQPSRTVREGVERAASGRVAVEEAATVVAGGRGAADHFGLIEQLADTLGGAVGASRAVVDSNIRPVDEQVGKSGKTISPKLYFALGISGAIHHTMGMDTSGTVVAVNSDPEALIFQYADYGIVADASQVLPVWVERLKG